jgi:hypothetical protein
MLILVGNTRPQFAMENPGAAGNSRTRGSTAEENIHKMVDFPANYR